MARVVVVRQEDGIVAYALEVLAEKKRLEAGGLVFEWQAGQASALDTREIAKGRDVGNITVQRKGASGLEDVPYDVTFAFVVTAFHPEAKIIKK